MKDALLDGSVFSTEADMELTVQDVGEAFEAGFEAAAKVKNLVRYSDDETTIFVTEEHWKQAVADVLAAASGDWLTTTENHVRDIWQTQN